MAAKKLAKYQAKRDFTKTAEPSGKVKVARAGRLRFVIRERARVCPVCGTLPLLGIVRADGEHQGYRYLHCARCAIEWHFVRIQCSHSLVTEQTR